MSGFLFRLFSCESVDGSGGERRGAVRRAGEGLWCGREFGLEGGGGWEGEGVELHVGGSLDTRSE